MAANYLHRHHAILPDDAPHTHQEHQPQGPFNPLMFSVGSGSATDAPVIDIRSSDELGVKLKAMAEWKARQS